MARRNRNWARPTGRPFTDHEDEELCRMAACGLASEFWKIALPGRPFGEIAARRLELSEAGRCIVARPL